MSIRYGKHSLQGPYPLEEVIEVLEPRSGVYLILDRRRNGRFIPIDVGESKNLRQRLYTHNRKSRWQENAVGEIWVAFQYKSYLKKRGRLDQESSLRDYLIEKGYDLPCSQR